MNKYTAGLKAGTAVMVSLIASTLLAEQAGKGPVKVFILAGQSNNADPNSKYVCHVVG